MQYHEYEPNPKYEKHIQINKELDHLRKYFAGIGTKKAKTRLNKLTTPQAKILRLMMEIEDSSIRAKRYQNEWRASMYERKHNLIEGLIELYLDFDFKFGVQDSDIQDTTHIIYFDFEQQQISWHFDAEYSFFKKLIPEYPQKWDGKTNTYLKLESIYNKLYHRDLFS